VRDIGAYPESKKCSRNTAHKQWDDITPADRVPWTTREVPSATQAMSARAFCHYWTLYSIP